MNPMHQLTRRPVKAAFGALLLALAGVILALSGGQFWAAVQTRAGVEETYTTVAVVTGGLKATSPGSPTVPVSAYEADNCLMRWAREGWSVIRGQATMSLAGGYSPKLTPLTTFYRTDLRESDTRIDSEEDAPYNFAILEIEITEVGEESIYSQENLDDVYSEKSNYFFSWEITGKVVGVQAMSGDWDDPTGRNTNFSLQIDGSSDAEGKALQAGQRILVFAHHYRDLDFEQRCRIARDLEWATGSPREIDPDVPEALEKICMKAMASDIDRRYPTADAMLADLEEFRKNPDVDLDFSIEDLRRPDTDEPTQYIPAVQAVTPKREEPQEDEPVDEKKTQKMLLLAGGIALAAVIVFALWNVIMGSFRKEPVQTEFTVPNLLGMTIEEAEADERVKGIFTITEMGSRASSEYAEGQIVEQTPAADNVVRSNREIQIFVSTGEKTEPMQSVTGLEWRSAKIILDDLGLDLQYNWKDEYSDSITSGCVIRTEPAKGEMLRQGDVLLLYRSKGPEPKPVTVISFLTYEQTTAVEEAETLGLKVTVKHVYSDALAGTVVEQSIAQDTVVTTGAEIVLTVSDGPDPSVSGTEGIPPEAA